MKTPLNLIEKAFLLKKTALFNELDLDLLLTIAEKLESCVLTKGGHIFQAGQEAKQMYLITQGRVHIFNPERVLIAELSEGEFFGDEALLNEKPRGYTALAASDLSLLTLSRSHLLTIISECPTVALGLLEAYAAKVPFRMR